MGNFADTALRFNKIMTYELLFIARTTFEVPSALAIFIYFIISEEVQIKTNITSLDVTKKLR